MILSNLKAILAALWVLICEAFKWLDTALDRWVEFVMELTDEAAEVYGKAADKLFEDLKEPKEK